MSGTGTGKGTIAGVVIGAFIGGFIIAVLLVIYVVRHGKHWKFQWLNPPSPGPREARVGGTTLNGYSEPSSGNLGKELISQPDKT